MSDLSVQPLSFFLADVIDNRGKTPKKLGGEWESNGHRAVSAKNIKNEGLVNLNSIRYINDSLYKRWMKKDLIRGDILLTSEAPAGQVLLWDSEERIVLSQRLFGLKINDKIDPVYLSYYLQSEIGQKEIHSKISGSTVSGISAKTFDFIKVHYPTSKNHQASIGALLLALDRKIRNNNKIIKELNEQMLMIFEYWFVQYDFPNKTGNPYKSSGGKLKKDSRLSYPIPEDWSVAKMDELIKLQKGISYTSEEIASENGIPMINLGSVNIDREYNHAHIKHFNGKVPKSKKVSEGDLLIACTDLTKEADIIGCPISVPGIGDDITFSMDLARVDVINDELSKGYLYMLLRTSWYHRYIKRFASGTNVIHLDTKGIYRYFIPIPHKELQKDFEDLTKPIHKLKSDYLIQNQELRQIRDWLLPMLINGQVKVKDAA